MTTFKIAARNLVRNRQRAVAAFFIVIVGSTSLILADGFIQWVLWAMRESAIQSQLGHIQVMQRILLAMCYQKTRLNAKKLNLYLMSN